MASLSRAVPRRAGGAPGGRLAARMRAHAARAAWAAVGLAAVVAAWQALHDLARLPDRVLPAPATIDHLHANSTVLDTIASTGDLDADTEEALKVAVEEFHRQWLSAGRGVSDLDSGEVVAERTREEISRGRTSEKA